MYGGIACDWNNYDPNGSLEHSGTNWTNKGGGYLQMSNGSILNSRYGVYMAPYERLSTVAPFNPLANASYFTGTTFMQNAQLADITFIDAQGLRLGTDRHFESVQCSRVNFTNCRFKGFPTLLRQYRGYGIRAKDSEIFVTTNTGTPAFNFEDLAMGAFGTHTVRRMNIEKDRFNNCDMGILQIGGDLANFNNNTINVPIGVSNTTYTCGVRIQGNVNPNITSNTISGLGTGVNTDFNRGIYVQDLGTYASLVGFNTFDKLRIGLQTAGTNGISGTSTAGMAARCNNMNAASFYDWVINGGGTGVFPQQGSGCNPLLQSGNKFLDGTGCGSPAAENIFSGVTFNYVGSTGTSEDPNCVSANVSETICPTPNTNNCIGSNLACNTPACNQANIAAMNTETDPQLKDLLRNRIVDYYLTVDSPSVAIGNLNAWNTPNSQRRLVGMYLRMRQWANAQSALNAVGSGNVEDAAFTTVYQTMIDIANAGGNILTFNATQKNSLTSIAGGKTSVRHNAMGLLNAAAGTPINLYWEEPDGSMGSSVAKSLELPAVFGDLVAMPNPFSGSTTILCRLPEYAQEVHLVVTDLQGRMIEDRRLNVSGGQMTETVSGEGKPDGVYVCSVIADGALLGISRIIVQH